MSSLEEVLQNQAAQGEQIKNIEKTCEEIRVVFLDVPIRIDRLEQQLKIFSRVIWLITSGFVGAIVFAIVARIGWV